MSSSIDLLSIKIRKGEKVQKVSVNVSSVKFCVLCNGFISFHFSQNIAKKGKGVHLTFEEAGVSTYFFN